MLPIALDLVPHMCQQSITLAAAITAVGMQLDNHYPWHQLFKTTINMEEWSCVSYDPLICSTVFTDTSRKSRKAGYMWKDSDTWKSHTLLVEDSVQLLELEAVIVVLQCWPEEDINIVCTSQYTVGVVQWMHRALIGHVNNLKLFQAFCCPLGNVTAKDRPSVHVSH